MKLWAILGYSYEYCYHQENKSIFHLRMSLNILREDSSPMLLLRLKIITSLSSMVINLLCNSSKQLDCLDLLIKLNHDLIMTNPLCLFLWNESYRSLQLVLLDFLDPKFVLNSFFSHPKSQLFGLIYAYSKQSRYFESSCWLNCP